MSVLTTKKYHDAVRDVSRWCSWYTRTLDPEVATTRRDELASDLYEQAISADESGATPHEVARTIRSRAVRGALADLVWRHSQLKHLAHTDPVGFRLHRVEGIATALVLAVASVVTGMGVFVIVRIALSTIAGDIRPASATALTVTAFTALALGALALLLRHRTRVAGALMMTLASFGIVHFGLYQLYSLSATIGALTFAMPGWDLASTGAIVGLAFFFTAAAVWWWPEKHGAILDTTRRVATREEITR